MNLLIRTILLLLMMTLSLEGSAQLINNPSFEGIAQANIAPFPWQPCNTYSSPDTQPGSWFVNTAASNGNTYISLVTRGNYGVTANLTEAAQIQLITELIEGKIYSFKVDLAFSNTFGADTFWDGFISFANPVILKVWGGVNSCEKSELLWEFSAIDHTEWRTYEVNFTPQMDGMHYMILEANYISLPSYFGNVLIDNIIEKNEPCIDKDAVNLGKDTTLCEGQILTLNASSASGPYLWSDGSTGSNLKVSDSGKYWVKAYSNGCPTTDTVIVSFESPFKINLINDTTICNGQSIILQVSASGKTFLWSDHSTNSSIKVSEEGLYWVDVQSGRCVTRDSIQIRLTDCLTDIPNIITPNGDSKNDTFIIKEIQKDKWEIVIVNRFGNQVYKTLDYKNNWSGTGLPTGIYYYKLTNQSNKKIYKGWVQILY